MHENDILFLPNFSYFFPIILSKFPNFGILTATIFPKIWTVSRNFTKNFFSQKMSWSLAKQSFSCKIFNCVMMFLSQKVQKEFGHKDRPWGVGWAGGDLVFIQVQFFFQFESRNCDF